MGFQRQCISVTKTSLYQELLPPRKHHEKLLRFLKQTKKRNVDVDFDVNDD
jgi:hypothetical protein